MRKPLLLLTLILCAISTSFGQTEELDDVLRELEKAKEDTSKVDLLIEAYKRMALIQIDSSRSFIDQAISLSDELDYKLGRLETTKALVYYFNRKSNPDSSYFYANRCVDMAYTFGDSSDIVESLSLRGGASIPLSKDEDGIHDLLNAADIAERNGLIAESINAYNELSRLLVTSDGQAAIGYMEKALKLAQSQPDKELVARAHFNLFILHDSALVKKMHLDSVCYLSRIHNLPLIRMNGYFGYANYYQFVEPNLDSAKKYAFKSLAMAKSIGVPKRIALLNQTLGNLYKQSGQYDSAQFHYAEYLRQYESAKQPYYYYNGLLKLSEVLALDGRHQEAYDSLNKAYAMSEEYYRTQLEEKVLEANKKYEAEKKDKQILIERNKSEKQKRQNRIILSALLVSLVLGGLIIYNLRNAKRLKESEIDTLKAQQETRLLESTLEGEERERNRLGKELHDSIGGMLSLLNLKVASLTPERITEESHKDVQELIQSTATEVRNISHNLLPKNIVEFGLKDSLEDLCFQISSNSTLTVETEFEGLNDRLKTSTEFTLYRICQELLNNIVKHANATSALLRIQKSSSNLILEIRDNGIGMVNRSKKDGVGLENVRKRLQALNGKMDINSSQEKGTRIKIEMYI